MRPLANYGSGYSKLVCLIILSVILGTSAYAVGVANQTTRKTRSRARPKPPSTEAAQDDRATQQTEPEKAQSVGPESGQPTKTEGNEQASPDAEKDQPAKKHRGLAGRLKGVGKSAGKSVGKGVGKGLRKTAHVMTSDTAKAVGSQAVTIATGVKIPPPAANPKATESGAPSEQAVQQTGILKVTTISDGAEVYVDGALVGTTPAELTLAAGTYQVTVKAEGRKEWSRKVGVLPGSTLNLKATMVRK